MQLTMMGPAERDRELIADFAAERARLRKPQVMGITGLSPTHEARLRG